MRTHRRRPLLLTLFPLAPLLLLLLLSTQLVLPFVTTFVNAYTQDPCTRAARAQFQFPDCYLPALNPDLLLSEASFVLAHNAATGYLPHTSLTKAGFSWRYAQNQVRGSVYQQLQDGARALDVRPLLRRNGTVVLQHGSIRIPTTFETLVRDAVQWCRQHPDELVLLLPSHFAYETGTAYKFKKTTTSNNNDDDDDYFDYNNNQMQIMTMATASPPWTWYRPLPRYWPISESITTNVPTCTN